MIDPARIGQRVRDRREAKGLTREQLAVAAGVTSTTVRNLERGDYNTTLRVVDLVATALGMSTSALVRS